jgi:hypothetical protein
MEEKFEKVESNILMVIECAIGNSPECPRCKSWNALLDSFDGNDDRFMQWFKCRDCGFTIPKSCVVIQKKQHIKGTAGKYQEVGNPIPGKQF